MALLCKDAKLLSYDDCNMLAQNPGFEQQKLIHSLGGQKSKVPFSRLIPPAHTGGCRGEPVPYLFPVSEGCQSAWAYGLATLIFKVSSFKSIFALSPRRLLYLWGDVVLPPSL